MASKINFRALFKNKWLYAGLLPSFGLLAIFSYYPFFNSFYTSLLDSNGVNHSKFVWLANFVELLTNDAEFYPALKVMAVFAVADVVKAVSVPLFVALMIHHLRSERAKYIFRVLLVVPAVVPSMVGLLLWKSFLSETGMINELLKVIGMGQFATSWLGNEDTVIGALIFIGFPWVNGVGTLILLAGLINISKELYDAGRVDGVSAWRRMWNIEIPLILPQLRLLIILTIIGSIQSYESILIITQGGPYGITNVPGLMLYNNAFSYGRVGYASAIGIVLFLLIIGFTYINNRYNRVDA
ncbi:MULTISPECIES: carbohydrate ABC transporter permease [Paenibacillus]|uniref:ABC transmembrane type-1 domain-containing protein n=1 Tax=Paenibacillus agaridevorans TaxID=171404 RepID=A0A2R5EWM0_9BACL|nr:MULTISPECIES: sugar ABC transporter permease [Paenibacillus]QNK55908.1 sugar ABC transporter permease [Paenibacillus sp. PAMC21692]GBG07784.1 hypothetical protein PAT3040_02345 [Paenibacillus agaridevorans]